MTNNPKIKKWLKDGEVFKIPQNELEKLKKQHEEWLKTLDSNKKCK